ncbi:hypothetical protein HPB50_005257 [Hyalomma asiaticum]|uniref:Uncharacterized protein n=1 Tax=Hyalomma asiaticum TaxID=266040 RepID=A0ACB7T3J5_HYAAI|nr:hypothetical protein HPB50_005257 [Hyalomma asiaticum]
MINSIHRDTCQQEREREREHTSTSQARSTRKKKKLHENYEDEELQLHHNTQRATTRALQANSETGREPRCAALDPPGPKEAARDRHVVSAAAATAIRAESAPPHSEPIRDRKRVVAGLYRPQSNHPITARRRTGTEERRQGTAKARQSQPPPCNP